MALFFNAMKKYLPFLVLPFLVSCGGQPEPEVIEPKVTYPVYCIRDAIILEDSVLLDMPGYPHGMTDKYQEIDKDTYNTLDAPVCKSDDPRMEVKSVGIAWADGRDTDLDGNPLTD